jgi:hypothetical protein
MTMTLQVEAAQMELLKSASTQVAMPMAGQAAVNAAEVSLMIVVTGQVSASAPSAPPTTGMATLVEAAPTKGSALLGANVGSC